MKDLFLSFSAINDPKRKTWLSKVVNYMGGLHGSNLTSCTTHLVTNDPFSRKIAFAVKYGIKIMKLDWIDEIWNKHQNFEFTLRADDSYFDKFQFPIFNDLVFTTTGIEFEEKKDLMKLIEDNGGVFSQSFKSSTVKILITTQKEINSAKYKAAIKYDIRCLSPAWIRDSIAAGYSLPMTEEHLIIAKIKAMSTPEKVNPAMHNLPFDNTMLSDITTADFSNRSLTLDATKNQTTSRFLHSNQRPTSTAMSVRKNDTFKKPTIPNTRQTIDVPLPPTPDCNTSKAATTIEFSEDESIIPILMGKRVFAYGFKKDFEFTQITNECEKYGAHVVDSTFSKQVDYIITPSGLIDQDFAEPKMKHLHFVNDFWLEG
jgi:hypothetical protein